MKNLINYYYNLVLGEFKRVEDYFLFEIDNYKYEFLPFECDMKIFQKIYATLINNNNYCHEVIINKQNSIVTFYDNRPYVLLKKNFYIEGNVTFDDILNYDTITYESKELNWKNLWKDKIDYYEYQISQLGFKYKILRSSISYYIGLSENAIDLLNYVDSSGVKFYFCHRRVVCNDSVDNLFNPLNIIIDSRTRDIAEFLKCNYVNNVLNINEVIAHLEKVDLDYNESILLMARFLYPSYYFDLYDMIIQDKLTERKIEGYIKKNVYYETFLKQVYKYLKYKYNIPEIEWLEN